LQRIEKALEQMNVKLPEVVSDITGVTIRRSVSIAARSSVSGKAASSASTVQRSGVTSATPLTTKIRRVTLCPS